MTTFALQRTDAVAFLNALPDECLDLVVTDPPYESLEKHRRVGTTTRLKVSKASSNQWFEIFANDRFEELFRELYRVLRRDRHFYLFCDPETMFAAKPVAENCGFKFWKPLVWDKVTLGMGYHYRCRYEFVLFFEKGKRNLADRGVPDVLQVKRIRNGYPAEKPVDLLRTLIRQSTEKGELVCDPFFGSGSTGIAAAAEGCNFVGADISVDALEVASSRLRSVGAREDAVIAVEGQLGLCL